MTVNIPPLFQVKGQRTYDRKMVLILSKKGKRAHMIHSLAQGHSAIQRKPQWEVCLREHMTAYPKHTLCKGREMNEPFKNAYCMVLHLVHSRMFNLISSPPIIKEAEIKTISQNIPSSFTMEELQKVSVG